MIASTSNVLNIRTVASDTSQEFKTYGDGSVCINFAPGPMGLELEPVIVSSEREIGCRVKDYYFGLDYSGIAEDILQDSVSIGDIITHIESKNVQSAKFADILGLLRSLKDSDRKIVFKNISISCELLFCSSFIPPLNIRIIMRISH